jgi:hypothetical protein
MVPQRGIELLPAHHFPDQIRSNSLIYNLGCRCVGFDDAKLMYKLQQPHVHLRDGVYCFVRRVPCLINLEVHKILIMVETIYSHWKNNLKYFLEFLQFTFINLNSAKTSF